MTLRLRMPLRFKLQTTWSRLLDIVTAPITSRLTVDEYFACQTRGDCLRTYFRRRCA